jgi:hypothetical protein
MQDQFWLTLRQSLHRARPRHPLPSRHLHHHLRPHSSDIDTVVSKQTSRHCFGSVARTGSYFSNPEALAVIWVRKGVISVGHLTTSISSVCRSQGARRVSQYTVAKVDLRRLTVMLASSASSSSVASDKDRIPGTTSCKIFPTFAGLVFPNVPTKAA